MKVEVDCYSGYKGDERPVRFRAGGREYVVEEVVEQWHGPQAFFFKAKTAGGGLHVLRRDSSVPEGAWAVEPILGSG